LEKYISVLKKSIIFNGLSDEEIRATLIDLTPKKISYEKGNFIIRNGDIIKSFGIMISGKAIVIKEDFWGNRFRSFFQEIFLQKLLLALKTVQLK